MNFYSSDTHLFHNNILKYCNRPFKDIREMHNQLIKNHNSIVTNDDITYYVGDFAVLRKDEIMKIVPILKKLNGKKVLILGNHDEGFPLTYIKCGFHSVHTSLELNDFVLRHDPNWCLNPNKKYIVGHTHKYLNIKNMFNVGVDVNNYFPVPQTQIEEYFKDFYV